MGSIDRPVIALASFRHVDGAVDRLFRGSVLLVDRAGTGHELGGMAAMVWAVLDQPGTAAEVGERLAQVAPEAGPPPPTLIHDALELLVADGLIVSSNDS